MRAGDATAADELFRHVGERLRRLARKMLRGFPTVRRWEETSDVVQKASLRLLQALGKVRPDSTRGFFTLASKHMRYVLLDLNKHYQKVNALHHSDGIAGRSGTPAHEPLDPAPSLDELEEWCLVHTQIDKLPKEERAVVDLHFYQGLSKGDAAEILGVHIRTVQRLWNAALQRLHAPRRGDGSRP
jgi:RNA polymerase sigma-70 factor (ECF subfamily)